MILYLDTSALVKLYLLEEGSDTVRQIATAAGEKATSLIAYVETRSAFSRKLRMREISRLAFGCHRSESERDWEHLTKTSLDRFTITRAAELIERLPLKSLRRDPPSKRADIAAVYPLSSDVRMFRRGSFSRRGFAWIALLREA